MLISYLLTYLSNENQEAVDVHFDDFAIYHGMSNVAQIDDYYPFGLTFNSYYGGVENRYRFNGMEQNPSTGNYETLFRGYDPALGRFMQIDPLADFLPGINTYQFAYNNPILLTDATGLAPAWWGRFRAWTNMVGKRLKGDMTAGEWFDDKEMVVYRTEGHKKKGQKGDTPNDDSRGGGSGQLGSIPPPKVDNPVEDLSIYLKTPEYIVDNNRDKAVLTIPETETGPVSGDELKRSVTFNGAHWSFLDRPAAERSIMDAYKVWMKSPHLKMLIRAMTEVPENAEKMESTKTGVIRNTKHVLKERVKAIMTELMFLGVPREKMDEGDPVFDSDEPGFQIDFE